MKKDASPKIEAKHLITCMVEARGIEPRSIPDHSQSATGLVGTLYSIDATLADVLRINLVGSIFFQTIPSTCLKAFP